MLILVLINSLVGVCHNLELQIYIIMGTCVRLSEELFIFFSPTASEILEESALQCTVHILYVKGQR